MNRPSKKDIKAAVEKLKQKGEGSSQPTGEQNTARSLEPKKSSKRIRKQGV